MLRPSILDNLGLLPSIELVRDGSQVRISIQTTDCPTYLNLWAPFGDMLQAANPRRTMSQDVSKK